MINRLAAAIDRLELELCDRLSVPRDALQLPPCLRECIAELRAVAGEESDSDKADGSTRVSRSAPRSPRRRTRSTSRSSAKNSRSVTAWRPGNGADCRATSSGFSKGRERSA
jgi:hypothetical protein